MPEVYRVCAGLPGPGPETRVSAPFPGARGVRDGHGAPGGPVAVDGAGSRNPQRVSTSRAKTTTLPS